MLTWYTPHVLDAQVGLLQPQAGILDNEENLATDSDQVKAPVIGIGFTDFGGSQKHEVANQAGAEGVVGATIPGCPRIEDAVHKRCGE